MVRLTSPVTDVEIKATGGYKFNNNVAGEIIYEITLAFATGGIVSLDVTSIIS